MTPIAVYDCCRRRRREFSVFEFSCLFFVSIVGGKFIRVCQRARFQLARRALASFFSRFTCV